MGCDSSAACQKLCEGQIVPVRNRPGIMFGIISKAHKCAKGGFRYEALFDNFTYDVDVSPEDLGEPVDLRDPAELLRLLTRGMADIDIFVIFSELRRLMRSRIRSGTPSHIINNENTRS